MGRSRKIDSDRVLDAAGAILLERGTGALTMDAIAHAAGVSKGGLQARFGSKEGLVEALMAHWRRQYDLAVRAHLGDSPAPAQAVHGHVALLRQESGPTRARAAGMLAALIGADTHKAAWSCWYLERFGGLGDNLEARRARLALLAAEGAFLLRAVGCVAPDDRRWQDVMADVASLLDGGL